MIIGHLSRTARGLSRSVSRPAIVTGAVVLSFAALGSTTAVGASVAARPAISFFSGAASVTAGGHRWLLSFSDAFGFVAIDISTAHESDSWTFPPIPASDFTANSRTGVASLDAHNALAPVAFLKIKFAPTSRRKAACRTGSDTIFTGTATGSVSLVANNKGLKLRAAHARFRSSFLDVDRGCVPPAGSVPCGGGFWNAGTQVSATGFTPGTPVQRTFTVSVGTTKALSRPAGTFVSIDVFGTGARPIFNKSKRTLTVSAGRSGRVTGSAVLSGSLLGTHTSRCRLNGHGFKQHSSIYAGSYVSPRGGQFQARSIVAGPMKATRTGPATFEIVTLSRA